MTNYVKTQEVFKDVEPEGDGEGRIPDNLQGILAHVEDLMTIRDWVGCEQLPNMYMNPDHTEISDK